MHRICSLETARCCANAAATDPCKRILQQSHASLLAALAFAVAAAEIADISPDGDVRTNEWISVPLKFNDKDTVDVSINLDEDAVAAALRYVWDIAKRPDAGFARKIADVLEEASSDTPVPDDRAHALAGSNATRLKTAGKHVKRAEEAREDRPRSAAQII